MYSYAGKLTLKLSNHHQVEGSIFGDPTYSDFSRMATCDHRRLQRTFDKLQFGTRNSAARYNGTLSPTWLVKRIIRLGPQQPHRHAVRSEPYRIVDRVQRIPCDLPGSPNPDCTARRIRYAERLLQGLGYYENTTGDNYGINVDTSKTGNFLGQHNFTIGYRYDRSHYDGTNCAAVRISLSTRRW